MQVVFRVVGLSARVNWTMMMVFVFRCAPGIGLTP